MSRIVKQMFGVNRFEGDAQPTRVPFFSPGRHTWPFPHPWNYDRPIDILATYYHDLKDHKGSGRNNRFLDFPAFNAVLVTRDPGVIKAILMATGDKPEQFDRDTYAISGIARVAGKDTLIYANGPLWKLQRKLAAPTFGKSTLFNPEKFQEFEETFRATIGKRLDALSEYFHLHQTKTYRVKLEFEIKVVMLEMLVNNFFGANVAYDELREKYTPAIERVITHIVSDTVLNKTGIPFYKLPGVTPAIRQYKEDFADFERLTDLVLEPRKKGKGLWHQFKSDAPDEALRSNIRAFLAGALEATTSTATWAVSHLARNPEAQERVYQEVEKADSFTPDNLKKSKELNLLIEETLRLTPALYFLPRKATMDTWIQTDDGRKMMIPKGTHILCDVWHANRLEEFWGVKNTGYPADIFEPKRWDVLAEKGHNPKTFLHFGFGHGARVCPGKFLGQLEVGLVVGALVKKFKFTAVRSENPVFAGVSTRPRDGVEVDLELRNI